MAGKFRIDTLVKNYLFRNKIFVGQIGDGAKIGHIRLGDKTAKDHGAGFVENRTVGNVGEGAITGDIIIGDG